MEQMDGSLGFGMDEDNVELKEDNIAQPLDMDKVKRAIELNNKLQELKAQAKIAKAQAKIEKAEQEVKMEKEFADFKPL